MGVGLEVYIGFVLLGIEAVTRGLSLKNKSHSYGFKDFLSVAGTSVVSVVTDTEFASRAIARFGCNFSKGGHHRLLGPIRSRPQGFMATGLRLWEPQAGRGNCKASRSHTGGCKPNSNFNAAYR